MQGDDKLVAERRDVSNPNFIEDFFGESKVAEVNLWTADEEGKGERYTEAPLEGNGATVDGWIQRQHWGPVLTHPLL